MPETLTTKQAQERLGVSRTTLWKLRRAGKVSSTKVGNRRLYAAASVERYKRAETRRIDKELST